MQAASSLIDDLELAIRGGSADKRAEMLRRMTDLFLGNAEQYNHEQVDLFGDVLNRLIEQVESRILPELSQKLAPVNKAPRSVIQKLAHHDEIDIAAPVLANSSLLSDRDLIEIAREKSQEHLSAISERAKIASAVTDILVQRGDTRIVRKLSRNQGASFSQSGFSTLAKRAEKDEELTEHLAARVDLPPQMLDQLMAKATEALRNRLAARLASEFQDIQVTVGPSAPEKEPNVPPPRDFRLAETIIDRMKERHQLNEAAIFDFATAGRYEEMTVGMARLCSASVMLLDRLMQNPRYDGVLVACKAFGLHWPTFEAILANRFPVPPAPSETERARADFFKLSATTAQRMFRFWLVRGVPK